MAQKKNRRGLGRGLSALIQDTTGATEGDADRREPLGTTDSTNAASVEATDVVDRYLENQEVAQESDVPRETRRPVDIFFPDAVPTPEPEAARKAATGRLPMPNPIERPKSQRPRVNEVDNAMVANPPEDEPEAFGEEPVLTTIRVSQIVPNHRQPRDVFDEEDMSELVASVREVGVLQPIVVRPTNVSGEYELVMGERRWRASKAAGLEEIPVIIRNTSDQDLLRDALLENIHRSELNPLEEAAAYEQLLRDFNCTQDELSERIGRSRPQISNTLRLMKLPPLVQRRVASGVLSAGHARALLGLEDEATMERVAQKVMNEGLSVRATEELVSVHLNGSGVRNRRQSTGQSAPERFDYLANSLTDELDTSVNISLGAKKGKIAIDFASVEDLNRIMDLIQPSKRD